MKRKILAVLAAVFMLVGTAATVSAGVGVTINGSIISFDVQPQIINSRTMVPMRAIFEALGADVEWDGEEQAIYSAKDDTIIVLQIGVPAMLVNDDITELDVAPIIFNDRTLVPVRAISEAFGLSVNWDAKTQTVIITSAETSSDTNSSQDYTYQNDTDTEQDNSDSEQSGSNTDNTDSSSAQTDMYSSTDSTGMGHQVLDLVNKYRSEAGLSTLTWDEDIAAVALAHSEDMSTRNFFDPTNLDGLTPFDRLDNYGISYIAAAENIAMGQKTAEAVMSSWMNSAGHYTNIMNASFKKIGVGVAYNSSGTVYWTQCFTN